MRPAISILTITLDVGTGTRAAVGKTLLSRNVRSIPISKFGCDAELLRVPIRGGEAAVSRSSDSWAVLREIWLRSDIDCSSLGFLGVVTAISFAVTKLP